MSKSHQWNDDGDGDDDDDDDNNDITSRNTVVLPLPGQPTTRIGGHDSLLSRSIID